jgi:spermidine/putrescine-binding protein
MKRRAFLSGALAAGVPSCRHDPRPRLNVYNWSAYVAPDTIPNFEKE